MIDPSWRRRPRRERCSGTVAYVRMLTSPTDEQTDITATIKQWAIDTLLVVAPTQPPERWLEYTPRGA